MSAFRERTRHFLRTIYVLCVLAAMVWALSGLEMDAVQMLGLLPVMQSIIFVCAWILMVFVLGLLWSIWLRRAEGVALEVSEWLPAQAMGWGGRYLPGKVGLFMGKLTMVRKQRLGMRALLLSVMVEQLGFVIAGACVALLLFSPSMLYAWGWLPSGVRGQWCWLMPAGLFLAVLLMGASVTLASRMAGGGDVARKSLWATALLVPHAAPHLLVGAAFYALAVALFPQVAAFPAAHLVSVLALAHVAGILAVFAPAGFGVRELVLAEGLRGILSFEEALLLASVLRILTLLADGVIVAAVAVLGHRWRRAAQ